MDVLVTFTKLFLSWKFNGVTVVNTIQYEEDLMNIDINSGIWYPWGGCLFREFNVDFLTKDRYCQNYSFSICRFRQPKNSFFFAKWRKYKFPDFPITQNLWLAMCYGIMEKPITQIKLNCWIVIQPLALVRILSTDK